MHEVEVGGAGRVAGDGRRIAVGRMIERVHGEAGRERLDVPGPVPPGPHTAVKQDDVWPAAAPAHRHPW